MTHDPQPPDNTPKPHSHAAFLYGVILTLAFGGLVYCGFQPHYTGILTYGGNTDDVRATMFVSGVCVPGGPSEKLLYSNQLIGYGLSYLYTARPDVPWYGLYLTGSYLIAHLVIIYSIFRISDDFRTRLATVLFLFTFGCHIWVSLNFTRVACIVAMAGISINACAVIEESGTQRRRPFYFRIILGWSLVAFAGLIRWQSVELMGLILAPAMLILAKQSWKDVSGLRHLTVAGFAILLMFAAESWSQMQLQSAPEWETFKDYERPMARLINNRRAGSLLYEDEGLSQDTAATLKSVGWSPNDAEVFDRWLFIDESVYSTENVAQVDTGLTLFTPSLSEWFASGLFVMQAMVQPLLILFAVISLAQSIGSRLSTYISSALFWLVSIFILTMLHLFMKLENHVTVPTLAAACLSTLIISIKTRAPTGRSGNHDTDQGSCRPAAFAYRLSMILLIGAMCLSVWKIKDYYSLSRSGVGLRPKFMRLIEGLDKGPDHIYLLVLQFPFHRVSPFDTMKDWEDWHFLYTDGDLRSPRYYAFLNEHGITDLTTALYSDRRVHVITIESNVERLAIFLKEHRGIEIGYTKREVPPITIFQLYEKP